MAATTKVGLLKLESRKTWTRDGREFELKNADGQASEAQVMALYKRGRLAIVAEPVEVFTKGEASFALDVTSR